MTSAPLDLDAAGGLASVYAYPALTRPWVRANFVASVDGATSVGGTSAALGSDADHRVFTLLRELCDVLLVGAGTVRAEGYGGLSIPSDARERRLARGQTAVPVLAVVTNSARIEPGAPVLAAADGTVLVLTSATSSPAQRQRLDDAGAQVVLVGERRVELGQALAELGRRGLHRVLCEGGPSLLRDLLAADLLDELCLTVSPKLVGPHAAQLLAGEELGAPVPLDLTNAFVEGGVLLLTYTAGRST